MESIELRVSWTPPASTPEATRYEWENVYDFWGDLFEYTALNPEDADDYRERVNFVDLITYSSYEENGEVIPVATGEESEIYDLDAPDPNDTTSKPSDKKFPYLYVIITNDYAEHDSGRSGNLNLMSKLKVLVDWKTEKGIPATRRTVDWIKNNYEPPPLEYDDPQVRVRMFIEDAWRNWGTEYVICVGDVDPLPSGNYQSDAGKYGIVPMRCFRYEPYYKYEPTDIYYCSLDEEWDKNGNQIWGEEDYPPSGDEPLDFKPDLAVGWVPCQNGTELETWLDKLITYETDPDLTPINGGTYLSRFVHVGADQLITNGPFRDYYGTRFLIRDWVETAGYDCVKAWEGYAAGGDPTNGYKIQWPTYPEPGDINEALEVGCGIVEIDTHGSPRYHYVMTQNEFYDGGAIGGYLQTWTAEKNKTSHWSSVFADSVEELENGPMYPVAYSWSCSSNRFMHFGFGGEPAVSEAWLFNEDGGGVAYLGNTHEGHFITGAELTRLFYRMLLNASEPPANPETVLTDDDLYFLGITQTWSKYWLSLYRHHPEDGIDWHTVYVHLLSGDPEMNVYTGDPDKLAVNYETSEGPGEGQTSVRVTITKGLTQPPGPAVYAANVCLYKANAIYLTNITNDKGHCEFVVDGSASGAEITATKHNFVPGQKTVTGG